MSKLTGSPNDDAAFLYKDLGVEAATAGRVNAHLVKANVAPEKGTGWHRHEADFRSIDMPAPCEVPASTAWNQVAC